MKKPCSAVLCDKSAANVYCSNEVDQVEFQKEIGRMRISKSRTGETSSGSSHSPVRAEAHTCHALQQGVLALYLSQLENMVC